MIENVWSRPTIIFHGRLRILVFIVQSSLLVRCFWVDSATRKCIVNAAKDDEVQSSNLLHSNVWKELSRIMTYLCLREALSKFINALTSGIFHGFNIQVFRLARATFTFLLNLWYYQPFKKWYRICITSTMFDLFISNFIPPFHGQKWIVLCLLLI